VLPLTVLLVLASAAVAMWRVFFAAPAVPDSIVTLSGRIEGDDSAVAPKVAGKILEIRVREGDAVRPGDVIAVLDDSQIRAQEDQARAALASAEVQAQSARDQVAVLEQQLEQNRLQTAQAGTDAQGQVRQAEADLATAEASLAQQQAAYQNAVFNRDAYTRLAQQGVRLRAAARPGGDRRRAAAGRSRGGAAAGRGGARGAGRRTGQPCQSRDPKRANGRGPEADLSARGGDRERHLLAQGGAARTDRRASR
jgi:HlyD family secretion protein